MRDVLVVYWHPDGPPMRPSVQTHLRTLDRVEGIQPRYVNGFHDIDRAVRRRRWHAVVLHTTFLCMRWSDVFAEYARRVAWLADVDCIKIAIPQDEYDHSEILDEWLYALGATNVLSNFGAEVRPLLYPIMHDRARFSEVLTGYVDSDMVEAAARAMRPIAERPLHVVYRAADLPYWFGKNGQRKVRIGEAVRERASAFALETDISLRPEDTIVGAAWTEFLASARTVTGCETGSSAVDRRGEIQASVRSLVAAEPEVTFAEVSARLPDGWDGHQLTAIGPRHFEAIATRTCQILVEGRYSGILEPEAHYVAIADDLSNLDAVLERVRDDPPGLQEVADRAFEEIVGSGQYTYDRLAAEYLAIV